MWSLLCPESSAEAAIGSLPWIPEFRVGAFSGGKGTPGAVSMEEEAVSPTAPYNDRFWDTRRDPASLVIVEDEG